MFCFSASATTHLHRPTSTGKDYYVVFPKAAWGNQSVGVLINSPTKQKITVTTPSGAKGIINITELRTTRYYAGQFRIESDPERVLKSEATRIQSPNPISVHGQFGIAGISGTFTALPVTSWGKEYYAVDAPEGQNSSYYNYSTVYSVPMITLIGAYDNTTVTITPTALTAKGHAIGVPYSITLNAGDVFNITTAGDPRSTVHEEHECIADLSGTHIVASQPIGAIVSQSHTSWPCGTNECGDYGVEWLPPVSNWDSTYVLLPSVQRLNDAEGEHLRVVFAHDSTELFVDSASAPPRTIGIFSAGQFLDYPCTLGSGIIMHGSHPFLPILFSTKPTLCTSGSSGGENWNFSMMIPAGVHQWSDDVPFSSAVGSLSNANVYFKVSDAPNLKFNGKPLLQQFPTPTHLPDGYAMITMGINSGSYNEITGDSGATAGGDVWGYGTLRFSPSDGSTEHVQDPEVIKSFSHPIGISAVPFGGESDPPTIVDTLACGVWTVSASDSVPTKSFTGIYDVSLLSVMPDSSFNVQFNPSPKFAYGASSTQFKIEVINLSQPAQAVVHIRDGAGNELDTVLYYDAQKIDVSPPVLDVGAIRVGDSVSKVIRIYNHNLTDLNCSGYHLKFGAAHHWSITPATHAFDLTPGDSVSVNCTYVAPDGVPVDNNDTLIVSTCKDFTVAVLHGRSKSAEIFTQCYEFGNAMIDTLTYGGDTISSTWGHGVWVASTGTDTLHITRISIVGYIPGEATFPQSDFKLGTNMYKIGVDSTGKKQIVVPFTFLPNSGKDSAWVLAPQETAFVEVLAHPHHGGPRGMGDSSVNPTNYAFVHFENDAKHPTLDQACLMLNGLAPGISASNVDYGTRLYATTTDSFFVVKNTGMTEFHLNKYPFDYGTSQDSDAFVFHMYVDPNTGGLIPFDIADTTWLGPHNNYGWEDTVRVPFRFIANAVGAHAVTITIRNSSPIQPTIFLQGNVVEPHIDGLSACIPDTIHVGDTISTILMLRNSGGDMLNVDKIDLVGAGAYQWQINKVWVAGSGVTVTAPPWKFTIRGTSPTVWGDKAYVFLQWIAASTTPPATNIHVTGSDALGRHSQDSVSNTFYHWSAFPYDTTMPIVNLPCLTGVDNPTVSVPEQNILLPNYPNPFSTATTLSYTVNTSGHVMLRIVNTLGETVSMLVNEHQSSGTYSVTARGAGLKAGMYFVEMVSGGERVGRKMMVVE